ncbi:MAG: ThiF family adenylyltransferase, partial [Ktedonobacterales bacterium]
MSTSESSDTRLSPSAPTTTNDRAPALSDAERYSRQTLFPGIGRAGQDRLARSRVLIVGCGATGSVLANNLARAGVGYLRIADRDFVEGNNLQRQVLYEESDALAGLPKAVAAARRIAGINSLVAVEPVTTDVTAENIEELLDGVDLALDGTDNFETRYLLNDACLKHKVPW